MRADGDVRAGRPEPRAFACHTPADPTRVWAALTDASQTSAYLYGLAAHSTWDRDAFIDVQHIDVQQRDRSHLIGRVLCAQPNERLSYVLQAGDADPPVYLTWLIRPSPGGCTIRLEIDEVEHADSAEDAEDTWLPVLAALQRLLAGS